MWQIVFFLFFAIFLNFLHSFLVSHDIREQIAFKDCIFVNISSIYPSFTKKVDYSNCTSAAKAGSVYLSFFSKTRIISNKMQSLSAIRPQMSWETRKSCKKFRKIAKKRKKSICHTSSMESTFGVPPRSYPESIW